MPKDCQQLSQTKILIIDDHDTNVRVIEGLFAHAGYSEVQSTVDSRKAFQLFQEFQPDLVLLDWHMPYVTGATILQAMREEIGQDCVPIIVLTADISPQVRQEALAGGATDFLTKPFVGMEVLLRVRNHLEIRQSHLRLRADNSRFESLVRERTRKLEEAQEEMLERLARAAECRDDDTGEHTQRVGQMAARLGEALGLGEAEVDTLRRAAPLHDVGKIAIPDNILLKPGKLTSEEFEVIKSHALAGARLLQNGQSDLVRMAEVIALTHHEKWDGHGYPHRLCGEEIPLVGRIVALVDVFDALTNERPYKKAWTVEAALEEIVAQRGRHFDPAVVDAFLEMLGQDTVSRGKEAVSMESFQQPLPIAA